MVLSAYNGVLRALSTVGSRGTGSGQGIRDKAPEAESLFNL